MHTLLNIRGDPNIGLLATTTNEFTLLPEIVLKKEAEEIKKILKTKIIKINSCGTPLNGCFINGNSNNLLVPFNFHEREKRKLSKRGIQFKVLESKFTALGNLILANEHVAIVSPKFSKKEVKKIGSAMNVKTKVSTIAGLDIVGSAGVATDKGVLVHPNIKKEELNILKETFNVPIKIGTINKGVSFVNSGLLVNGKGVVAGIMTTTQELIQVSEVFET